MAELMKLLVNMFIVDSMSIACGAGSTTLSNNTVMVVQWCLDYTARNIKRNLRHRGCVPPRKGGGSIAKRPQSAQVNNLDHHTLCAALPQRDAHVVGLQVVVQEASFMHTRKTARQLLGSTDVLLQPPSYPVTQTRALASC